MFKFPLSSEQMSPSAYVDDAQKWARDLVQGESRGPGDTDNAMRRLEAKYGVSYSLLWRLRYRRPKDIMVSAYARLAAVYYAERERQQRLAQNERYTAPQTRLGSIFTRTGDVLAGADGGPDVDGVVK